jgi:hypothetical protein
MFVWLEDGKLRVALQREFAPEYAIEIDTYGLVPVPPVEAFVKVEGNEIIKRTQEEVLEWLKNEKIRLLKAYVASLLAPTDYIITKIVEAQMQGDTEKVEKLKRKYAEQLQQREVIRVWNEQVKQRIMDAQSIDELKVIEIKFEGV